MRRHYKPLSRRTIQQIINIKNSDNPQSLRKLYSMDSFDEMPELEWFADSPPNSSVVMDAHIRWFDDTPQNCINIEASPESETDAYASSFDDEEHIHEQFECIHVSERPPEVVKCVDDPSQRSPYWTGDDQSDINCDFLKLRWKALISAVYLAIENEAASSSDTIDNPSMSQLKTEDNQPNDDSVNVIETSAGAEATVPGDTMRTETKTINEEYCIAGTSTMSTGASIAPRVFQERRNRRKPLLPKKIDIANKSLNMNNSSSEDDISNSDPYGPSCSGLHLSHFPPLS